jgi:hypothetical protein
VNNQDVVSPQQPSSKSEKNEALSLLPGEALRHNFVNFSGLRGFGGRS